MGNFKLRFVALVLAVAVMLVFCGVRLIQYQVVDGSEYLSQAENTTVSQMKENAARGKIVDRYGEELVGNKAGFNIVFNRAFMDEGTENQTILDLTRVLSENGAAWVDELPISGTAPYTYLSGRDGDVKALQNALGLQSYATADECMAEIISRCDLSSYSQADIRTLAGVRYGMILHEFSIYNPYTFAEDVSPTTVTIIKELDYKYPGVEVSEESIREYGDGGIIPSILGTMSPIYADEKDQRLSEGYALNDQVGRGGIEEQYESYLRGTAGATTVEQDKSGSVISKTETKQPVAGDTVMLTIDKQLQIETQSILEQFSKHLKEANGKGKDVKSGAIVVLDVKTGEILAVANYPTYTITDLSDPAKAAQIKNDPNKPTWNRAFWEIYRPGSTFKTITATGALTEGTINGSSTVTCGGTYMYYAPQWTPHCTGVHGTIPVTQALTVSCNIFFYDVGRRLGIDLIDKYAALYGFGQDTGLEIYNAKGQVSSPALAQQEGIDWNQGDTCQTAIGQGETKITPLQLAIQAATIANNGTRYAAHIVKAITNYDMTETVQETQPKVMSQIETTQEVYDLIHTGMRGAADRRATMVNIPGGVAIKTGTPQVTTTTTNSTVIGYYPAAAGTTPEIAAACVLEQGEYSADMLAQVIDAYIALKAQRAANQNGSSSQPDTTSSSSSSSSSSTERSFNVTGDPNADR